MSTYNPVKPGQLISAAFINSVLSSIDQRLSKLEAAGGIGGGAMVITGLLPAGPLHMGDQVTVLGQNFGLPSQVVVTINEARVDAANFLPGSGNSALVFQIPVVQGIPPTGQTVTLMVSNPTSAASYQFTLFPFPTTIPTGAIFATMTGPPQVGNINAGNSYIYAFTVSASTTLSDTYAVTASLDSASKAAGWTVAPVDPVTQQALNQIPIQQGSNAKLQVGVKVTIPGTPVVSAGLVTVTLTSSLNPIGLNGSGTTTVTLNSPPPPPNLISLSIVGVSATGPGGSLPGASFSGNTSITLPHGAISGVVAVNALCPNADSAPGYVCGPSPTGPTFDAAGWAGAVVPTKLTFPTTQANQTVLIQMNLTAIPAGPASTTLHFQVVEKNQTNFIGQISPTISVS
ncbi:MAG TPA: hypothetical protein VGL72_07635 [Bryobacteraceae bacterium]